MQKKLIALAVAGLASTAAFAQSNVTIYGVADVYYAHVSATGGANGNVNAINSGGLSGSRLGFKGVEDLGNGNKALFVLEYGLALDTNSGFGDFSARTAPVNAWGATGYNGNTAGTNNTARQQLIGLTGNWGTVAAGYLQTAGYDFACAVDPLAGGALDTTSKLPGQMLLNCGKGGRASNAAAYISPNFSGFSFAVNYAAGENNAAGGSADNAYLLAANYANGPIDARFVYSRANANSATALTSGGVLAINGATTNLALMDGSTVTEWGLGGSYDFGVAKLFASYQTLNVNKIAGPTNVPGTNKTWQLGVSAPVGPGVLAASYAAVKLDELQRTLGLQGDDKTYAVAYIYPLSKRTKVYGGVNRYDNDSNSTRAAVGLTPTAGGSTTTWGVGVNHSF